MYPIRCVSLVRFSFWIGASMFWVACASDSGTVAGPSGGASGALSSSGGSAPSSAGSTSDAGSHAVAGSPGSAGAESGSGGSALAGASAAGAESGSGGASGGSAGSLVIAGSGGALATAGVSGSAGGTASGCNLPATVSFKNDVQKMLGSSCGGSGCHVVDDKSTMADGGYTHAYDWITATAHASSCPSGAPKRFEVVVAVIEAAHPASCSKSRIMPPDPNTHAPFTRCQIETLKAWLAEPLVTQMHRADDTSPTTPYPMPPFN